MTILIGFIALEVDTRNPLSRKVDEAEDGYKDI